MKQILVPTDFSPVAQRAYPIAAQIAKATNSKLLLFYVHISHLAKISNVASYNTMAYAVDEAERIDIIEEKKAQEKFQNLINDKIFDGIEVDYEISVSLDISTEKDMLNFLNDKDHSMVIMGTEGEEQKGRHISEYIARHTLHPVITINNDNYTFNPKHIAICTDLKTLSTGFIQRMNFLSSALDVPMKFLFINTPKSFKDEVEIDQEVERVKHRYHPSNAVFQTINAHKVDDGILHYLSKNPTDIIALCTHGRTGLSHFLHGSHTEDMIVKSPVPVYSYNLHKYLESLYGHEVQANYTRGFTG